MFEEVWGIGRPLVCDQMVYARRNVGERCVNQLKQWRGLATRYEKRTANYRAMLVTRQTDRSVLWSWWV